MEARTLNTLLTVGAIVVGAFAVRRAFGLDGESESGPGSADPGPDVTLSPEVLRYLAREVYVAAWGVHGWDIVEDEERMAAAVLTCETNDDLLALSQAYGCRAPAFSLGCLSLSETFRRFFSRDQLAALNTALADKGLTIGL